METFVAVAILVAIVGMALWYVIKAKKSGKKCIGCPNGCCSATQKSSETSCPGSCSCCCGCPSQEKSE